MFTETKEFDSLPKRQDIALIHQVLRIPEIPIQNPTLAPPVIFLDKLWDNFPSDFSFSREQEKLLGFDNLDGKIECTEVSNGDLESVKQQKPHLFTIHSEPYQSKAELNERKVPLLDPPYTDIQVVAHNLPQPYLIDIQDVIEEQSAYGQIAIKFGETDNDPYAVIVVLKTEQWKNKHAQTIWWEIKHDMNYTSKRPFKYSLAEDTFVTEKLGLAIYRGFISVPPTATEPLRLRRSTLNKRSNNSNQ